MTGDYLKHFQNLELFRDLPVEDLKKILDQCREEHFNPGFVIFREGDAPDKFYIVLEGEVEIWKDYDSTYADILAIRGAGASFGEMSLIDELPRSATVKTVSSVHVLYLDRLPFRKIILENPQVALFIMKTVSKMVRVSNETFQYGLRQKNIKLEQAYEDLKKAQSELIRSERLSTLGKFASMLIHDLRNPISIIRGYAEMLSVALPESERLQSMVKKLLAEIDRLNRMVGELLDYSRGNIRLDLGVVFLDQLFNKIVENNRSLARGNDISYVIDNQVYEPVLADHDRLLRALSNLVDNARKAMRNGGTLTIRSRLTDDSVLIDVQDTGEGMSEDVKAKLFEPFFSASKAGGTGLGLLVVANVIEAHQGSIQVESTPGLGTTFHLHFPLHPRSL